MGSISMPLMWQGSLKSLTMFRLAMQNGRLIIQESKNATKSKMPSLGDIQDGLFRNILFYSIGEMYLGGQQIEFATRLKLTGKIRGVLKLPDDGQSAIESFADANNLTKTKRNQLRLLHQEVLINPGFSIVVAGNA